MSSYNNNSEEEKNNEIIDKKKEMDEIIKEECKKENEIIYEIKYIKFIIKDYMSFPRTERAKLLMYILNVPTSINKLEEEFGYILYGIKFELLDNKSFSKKFDPSLKIIINNKTDICFYYLEYRLLFFLDLSQSMLLFDLRQKILNIQKTEKYLNYLLKSCAQYEEEIYIFEEKKNKKFKPKIICTIASSSTEQEIIFIKHAFILDKDSFNKYQEKISKKINSILSKYSIKNQENENKDFLQKILENSLFTFNLMSSFGSRILFLLTDGNFYLENLGKYNNILMQLNRIDISIQIIELLYRNNCYGLTSPTFANDIETMKYLAQYSGGNYINENYFVNLFFPEEKPNENKLQKFFYPSLYPNILTYNSNEEESKTLWEKRFSGFNDDYYDEKRINCELCDKGFQIFLCKRVQIKENNLKNEIVLSKKSQITKIINNKGINIKSIGLLSNKISVEIKELFESYKITLSLSLIIESRLRESFYLKKTKNSQRIKFINYFLPGIIIKYNLTRENNCMLCEDFKVDILIKGNISKINQIKKEISQKEKKNAKIELLLNFIREIICTDKISSYFSTITHSQEYLEKDFFQKNKNYLSNIVRLSVHKWHRFYNVVMREIFIMDKTIGINKDFIETFLETDEYALRKCNEKQEYLKEKILKFCDDFDDELNIGIKKIPKEENTKGILSHNGFLIIKFDWMYKNLCLLYLGFFHCFLSTRENYEKKLKEFILKKEDKDKYNDKNLLIEINEKHLTYFLTQQKKEFNMDDNLSVDMNKSLNTSLNKIDIQKDENEKQEESIFTYQASQKLISIYLKQFQMVYELPFDSDIILRNFLENLLLERLKTEEFLILNWNKRQMILFNYLPKLKFKNYSSLNIKNNPLLDSIIIFYTIEIIYKPTKKLINTKLMLEPNENLFNLRIEEKDTNKNEVKRSYFKDIINYFEEVGNKIRESLKIPKENDDINEQII